MGARVALPEEVDETQILAALLGIAEMVGDLTDTHEMLESVVRIAPGLVRVDRCAVLFYDDALKEFRTAVAFGPGGRDTPFDGLRVPAGDMARLAQRLVSHHLPALIKGDSKDLSLPPALVRRLGVRAALLVPLVCRGRVLGLLWLDHSQQSHYFTSKEINIAQGIATSLAVALDGASRVESLEIERRRFDALARTLADGVIVLDRDLRILELDRSAEDLIGWQTSEVRGRRVHEVLDISEAEASLGWTRDARVPATTSKILSLRCRNGDHVACTVLGAPVRTASGDIVQILYVLKLAAPVRRAAPGPADALA